MDGPEGEHGSPLKTFLLNYLLPEKCYNLFFQQLQFSHEKCYNLFFQQLQFSHVPCVKIVLSKVMGLWTLAALLAPVPQIWTIVWASSSEGLSLVSVLLELLVVSVRISFCVHLNFPIGAWGESLFLLIQLVLMVFLIQHYRGDSRTGAMSLIAYAVFMYFLMSPLIPGMVVKTVQEWEVLIILASRLIQVGRNSSSGSTGQLSVMCVFLFFMGSLGQLFSSIQDSGHSLHSQACVLSSCCSAVLLLQVLLFQNNQPVDGERGKTDAWREKKKQ